MFNNDNNNTTATSMSFNCIRKGVLHIFKVLENNCFLVYSHFIFPAEVRMIFTIFLLGKHAKGKDIAVWIKCE